MPKLFYILLLAGLLAGMVPESVLAADWGSYLKVTCQPGPLARAKQEGTVEIAAKNLVGLTDGLITLAGDSALYAACETAEKIVVGLAKKIKVEGSPGAWVIKADGTDITNSVSGWQQVGSAVSYQKEEPLQGFIRIEATTAAGGPGSSGGELSIEKITEIINRLTDYIFIISAAVAGLMVLLAGFLFLSAAGKPAQIQTAQKMLLWAVIGFSVVLVSKGIVTLVETILR